MTPSCDLGQVCAKFRVIWLQCDCRTSFSQGLVNLPYSDERNRQIVVGISQAWIMLQYFPVLHGGLVGPPCLEQ